MGSLGTHNNAEEAAEKILREGEKELADEHQKHIQAEKARRQEILNERERIHQ